MGCVRKGSCVDSPQGTVDNIKELALAFVKQGKIVFIATIPQYNQASSDGIRNCNLERNTLLREFVAQ